MLRNGLKAAIAAALAGSFAAGASAQELYPGGRDFPTPTSPIVLDPGYAAPPGVVYMGRTAYGAPRYCLKQCELDTNPCDPAYFKHADKRCLQGAGF